MGAPAFTYVCDASCLPAELAAVDALARLRLALQRVDAGLVVVHASPELLELLELTGLLGVLGVEVER